MAMNTNVAPCLLEIGNCLPTCSLQQLYAVIMFLWLGPLSPNQSINAARLLLILIWFHLRLSGAWCVGAEGEGPAGKVPYSFLHVHRL